MGFFKRGGGSANFIFMGAGIFLRVPEEISRIAKCFEFQDFGHLERQTCRESWVDTAWDLVTTFRVGVFPSEFFCFQGRIW